MTVHRGTWTMEARAERVLRALPVEVPAGAGALAVSLRFPRAADSVLDLGLLGPAGEFRGWSGGAREGFTVTEEWATPGYLPGALTPGTWQVLLRLHRVPPRGLPYELTAQVPLNVPEMPQWEVPEPVPRERRRPSRALPEVDGARWLAGDLHAHTLHSDGTLGIDELARLAALQGLDFLAVTDHNTVSHHPHLAAAGARQGVTLLPGQEVTCDLGHANVFGDTGWIDFRDSADSWLAQAEAGGGVLSVNHPLADDCAWRLPFAGRRPRHAELWHHTWRDRRHGAPLAWARAWSEGRDREGNGAGAREGKGTDGGPAAGAGDLVPLGGSDFHRPSEGRPPGAPTTWVLAEDGDVLGGLAAGRTAVSAGPDAPLLLRCGTELVALGAAGTVLVRPDGSRTVIRGERAVLPGTEGMHRLETHTCEVLALCG